MSKLYPVVIDTETTGTDLDHDSICQVAAVLMNLDEGTAVTLYSGYCNPGRPIDPEATEVHGVTDAEVEWAIPAQWALMHVKAILDKLEETGDIILCGQNHERFDIPLMDRILPSAGFNQYLSFDSYTTALREFPAMPHKLGEFYAWYCEKEAMNAHDADADCHMVAAIIYKYMQERGQDLLTLALEQETPFVLKQYPFGKHKGVPLEDVPYSYLNWCRANFTEVHKDVEASICSRLGCDSFTGDIVVPAKSVELLPAGSVDGDEAPLFDDDTSF